MLIPLASHSSDIKVELPADLKELMEQGAGVALTPQLQLERATPNAPHTTSLPFITNSQRFGEARVGAGGSSSLSQSFLRRPHQPAWGRTSACCA